MKHIKTWSLILLTLSSITAWSQQANTDSLSLTKILSSVIQNYPALKKADKQLVMADAKIGLTKTAYLPNVNFSASYNRIGPVTTIPFGGKELQLYPPDMYNASVSVNQSIYDFGKTNKNLALDQSSKKLVELSVDQVKQQLSMAVVANFYTINFLEEAIQIKNDQLKTLNEHLQFVQKKAATGSAIQYDIMTTKVRISSIENQKIDLETALQIQISQLNGLLGNPEDKPLLLKKELLDKQVLPSVDSLCQVAFTNRDEMKLALQKEQLAKSKLEVIKVQNNPSLNFIASGGFKNGYFNTNFGDTGKMNYAVGVGLNVPIFDANRSKYAKIQAKADLESNQQDTELTRRSITNEVVESRATAEASLKKVIQSELQLKQATQAYTLADVNYKAGVITNLDLLDSFTALSESKLALYKTKIDYSVSLLKLKIALGQRIYE